MKKHEEKKDTTKTWEKKKRSEYEGEKKVSMKPKKWGRRQGKWRNMKKNEENEDKAITLEKMKKKTVKMKKKNIWNEARK